MLFSWRLRYRLSRCSETLKISTYNVEDAPSVVYTSTKFKGSLAFSAANVVGLTERTRVNSRVSVALHCIYFPTATMRLERTIINRRLGVRSSCETNGIGVRCAHLC